MDWKAVPPFSVNSNMRPLGPTFMDAVRPVTVSFQTGEEFVLEFLQERRAFPRSYQPSTSSSQTIANAAGSSNLSSTFVDKVVLGVPLMGFDGASEPLTVAGENMLGVLGNQGHPRFVNKVNKELAENALSNSFGEGSSRGKVHHFPLRDGYSVVAEYGSDSGASDSASENSLSGKIKLRCSYGGKMLPRPSDGTLRYAGGDTRIVRIKRNISFQEFMKEMLAIYEQVCLIKYPLPDGDFDELISVSSDEDLLNMMEEWSSSAGEVQRPHMPRVFLFSPNDIEYVSLSDSHPKYDNNHCNHYLAAINGLVEPGYGKVGQGLTSISGTRLNDIISVNAGGERVESHIVSSTPASDMLLPASNELFCAELLNTAADVAISSEEIQYGMLNREDSNIQFYFENAPHFVLHEPQLLSIMDPLATSHHAESRKVTPVEQVNKHGQQSYCPQLKELLPVAPSQMLLSPHISDFPAASPSFKEADFREKDIKVDGRPVASQGDYNCCTSVWESENRVHHINQQLDDVVLVGHNTWNNGLHLTKHLGGFPLSIYHKADEVMVASTLKGGTESLSSEHFVEYPKTYGPDPQQPHFVYAGQAHEAEGNHLDDDCGDSYGRVITQPADSGTRCGYFEPTMLRIMHAQMESLARFSKFEDSAYSSSLMHVQQREPIMDPRTGMAHGEIFGALHPSLGMDLVLEGITMQCQQLKNFPESLTQKAKHEMLEAPSLPQFPEVPVWKEPMVGGHLYDLGESSTMPINALAETAQEHTKEGGDAKGAVAVYVENSPLEHLVTAVSSENHFVKKVQVHQNPVVRASEMVPNNAYNVSKEGNTEKLDHNISNEDKEGRHEDNSSKEGKARGHVTKNSPPHVKEKKGQHPPPCRPGASDSVQLKEQPSINQKAQTSNIVEIKSGSDNASQAESTSNLYNLLRGLKHEMEAVNRHSYGLLMEEEYAEFSSQIHQPWEVGSAEDDIVNNNTTLSPGISPLFFNDSKEESSGNCMHNNEVGVSMTMKNHESENRSFWRLAREKFNRKEISLFGQDTVISSDSVRHCEVETRSSNCMPFQADGVPLHLHIQGHDKTIPQDSPAAIGNEDSTLFQEVRPPNVITDVVDMDTRRESVEDATHYSNSTGGETPRGLERMDGETEKENDGHLRIDLSLEELGIHELQIIKHADLEELRKLGSGTYGTVYHCKWKGSDVAIKRIKKSSFLGSSSDQARLIRDFWKEATILSKLQHPNVVTFYGIVKDGPGATFATVTEYMAHGSLKDVLQRKDRPLDQHKKLNFAMETAFGMEYLHSKNVVHFDLKSDNVLVNLRICKVSDFGLSKIKENTLVSGCMKGTLPWMAPELLNGNSAKVSDKVDVFSFGIVMWEILTGEEPYADIPGFAIIGGILNDTLRPPVPDGCDPEWRSLMEQCWSTDPAARPSFPEIVKRLRVMSE